MNTTARFGTICAVMLALRTPAWANSAASISLVAGIITVLPLALTLFFLFQVAFHSIWVRNIFAKLALYLLLPLCLTILATTATAIWLIDAGPVNGELFETLWFIAWGTALVSFVIDVKIGIRRIVERYHRV